MAEGVVGLAEITPMIVQITMQDRLHKNTFTSELVSGLDDAFSQVHGNERYRVVVLTGFDSYFCSGGTQEGLLLLQGRQGRFTDTNVYSLPLACDIPVIAAMQGHGIGGGLAFGLFSDCVVLSRESVYAANFMKYGFTPGMGATYMLPEKLGVALAHEMLLSARTYRGADLERRGVPFPVLPRQKVLDHAYELAHDLAEIPRASLVILKNHLVAGMRAKLSLVIEQEVKMHEQTMHLPQVKDRIQSMFGR